jgi:hypothetical protein
LSTAILLNCLTEAAHVTVSRLGKIFKTIFEPLISARIAFENQLSPMKYLLKFPLLLIILNWYK